MKRSVKTVKPEYDRFRLLLIHAPVQKKYGYPYVETDQFTRKVLQEMFLKAFWFEDPGDTTGFYKGRLDLDSRMASRFDTAERWRENPKGTGGEILCSF